MYLIYDTETTGLPKNFSAPVSDSENWPRLVQVAWQLHNDMGELIEVKNFIVRPEGFTIPYNAEKIHGLHCLVLGTLHCRQRWSALVYRGCSTGTALVGTCREYSASRALRLLCSSPSDPP